MRTNTDSLYRFTELHTEIDIDMKLFYVLALLTTTALATPTEVESSQVLVRPLPPSFPSPLN